MLTRANTLPGPAPDIEPSAIRSLRADRALLAAHLDALPSGAKRPRGQIDANLAIARAKIEDAESFDEAVSYLTPREIFAVLEPLPEW